jgi:thioredoxin reductase (NADPH)
MCEVVSQQQYKMENVIIIGSGPAGWTAAIYAARASLAPLLIEGAITQENQDKGTLPMGQLALTTEVENFPGFPPGKMTEFLNSAIQGSRAAMLPPHEDDAHGISGPELVELIRSQAVHFGTRVVTDDVVDVDFTGFPLKLIGAAGNVYETKTVIIATGASANYLGLPSENKFKNRGVSACAVCDGGLPRFCNKPIAVIGGGDAAIEEAIHLTKTASKVYLIHRRNEFRASKICAKRAEEHPKIEILWNRIPKEVLGNDQEGVTGVLLQSTIGEPDKEISAAGFFVAIGHTPNTKFLQGKVALTEKGYVARPVPFRSDTNVPGVFAAGDVADDYYRQANTAAAGGCMAAIDAERYLAMNE